MSFFSSIPTWGWFDILFNFAVLVALCGESHWALKWLIPNNSEGKTSVKWRREKLKKKFEFLLIIGIAGEVGCLPFSLYESANANKAAGVAMQYAANSSSNSVQVLAQVAGLNKEAADARLIAGEADERAANTESNNLVLQRKLQPRMINSANILRFMLSLIGKPSGEIAVTALSTDNETRIYSRQIRGLLNETGYVSSNYPDVIFEDPTTLLILPPKNHPNATLIMTISGETPPYATAVKDAFEAIGIEIGMAKWQGASNMPPVTISILEK